MCKTTKIVSYNVLNDILRELFPKQNFTNYTQLNLSLVTLLLNALLIYRISPQKTDTGTLYGENYSETINILQKC